MGRSIERETFEKHDYARFARRLEHGLTALAEVLARPGFGAGPTTIGAELELNLIDARGYPHPANRDVLARAHDRRLTHELDRFNLEANVDPALLAGRPFTHLEQELASAVAAATRAAAPSGGRIAVIGILPTLRPADLHSDALTNVPRYRALSNGIRRLRGSPFEVTIDGDEPLTLVGDDVTIQGANTSFQLHLRALPAEYAALHNAALVAAAPAVAVAGNSPFFLGRRLWHETRIAVFRQAVEPHVAAPGAWQPPARVSLGHGWVRDGIHELFAAAVALHEPVLPVVGPEDPLEAVRAGRVPKLSELRLHGGTVWSWIRPIYDPSNGGHIRIELRPLPAGPTVLDMTANAAFLLGLTLGLRHQIAEILPKLPFNDARRSFYRAARYGLGSDLFWPSSPPSPQLVPARALLDRLLPVAERGLVEHGVETAEASRLLGVIADRIARGQTGAVWQRAMLDRLDRGDRAEALARLLERYLAHSTAGEPVHTWPVE